MELLSNSLGSKGKLRGLSVQDRFDAQYMPEPNTGCWIWLGAFNRKGYASPFQVRRLGGQKMTSAPQRWAYENQFGVIGEGLVLDHLCRKEG